MNEIVSKKDVATLLQCGDQFICKLIKDGTLESLKLHSISLLMEPLRYALLKK